MTRHLSIYDLWVLSFHSLFHQKILLAPDQEAAIVSRGLHERVSVQRQHVQALQHVVQDVRLLDVGQFTERYLRKEGMRTSVNVIYSTVFMTVELETGSHYLDVLQGLWQRVEGKFEFSD